MSTLEDVYENLQKALLDAISLAQTHSDIPEKANLPDKLRACLADLRFSNGLASADKDTDIRSDLQSMCQAGVDAFKTISSHKNDYFDNLHGRSEEMEN